MSTALRSRVLALTMAASLVSLACAASAGAEAPVKLKLVGNIGWEVNPLTKGYSCETECQPSPAEFGNSEAGGFNYPRGVAVSAAGDVYIAETFNYRVQEFGPGHEFIAMFGKEVNGETGGDVCTVTEIAHCKQGVEGTAAGAFANAKAIAVEPAGTAENIYVQDIGNWSVDEYTASGAFVLRIGKEVDMKTGADVCTAASHDTCGPGVNGTEPGAFDFSSGQTGEADQLAVGPGPEHLLYVADHDRIQEFDSTGAWRGEIATPESVTALAIDQSTGTLYAAYDRGSTIHEFATATNVELPSTIEVQNSFALDGIAVDPSGVGYVVVMDFSESDREKILYVYRADDGALVSSTSAPSGSRLAKNGINGIGIDERGSLYASEEVQQEVAGYQLLPVGELTTSGGTCSVGPEHESSDTFECVLKGEVNPYDVANTEVLFEWGGTCAFGQSTASQPIATVEAAEPVGAAITGVRPNESLCFRIAGHDESVRAPEVLAGTSHTISTPAVAPKILGASVTAASSSSAVLLAEVNPENSPSESFFELAAEPGAEAKLAACADAKTSGCAGVFTTASVASSAYGEVGETFETENLQAGTLYRYRLNAQNSTELALHALGGEGTFETAPVLAPEPVTGAVSAVTQTGARIEGTVNPNGAESAYSFELGVYEGAATQYDIVVSGSTGTGSAPEAKAATVSGLQAGVTYAYRISVHNGAIDNEAHTLYGTPATFTTAGTAAALLLPASPPLLMVPPIAFPQEGAGGTGGSHGLTRAQKLARALKACRRKRSAGAHARCEKTARKRYGARKHGKRR